MKTLLLTRHAATPWGTFGALLIPGHAPFVTLEPPWRNNARNVSCIRPGRYPLKLLPSSTLDRITKSKFSKGWYVQNVPDRSGILFHPGNFENDTQGCILVGTSAELINGRPGVARSQIAYAALAYALANNPPESLLITWANGQPLADTINQPRKLQEAQHG